MKTILMLSVCLVTVVACDEQKIAEPVTSALVAGVDLSNIDATVRPQDDFYRYVNGQWLANGEIPADLPSYGSFRALVDKSEADVRVIVEELAANDDKVAGSEAQKVGDLYLSFMNVDTVEATGLAPLSEDLARIAQITSHEDLAVAFGYFRRQGSAGFFGGNGVTTPFGYFVNQDGKDATRYIGYVGQSGLGMPDRDYYLRDDERSQGIQTKYRDYITRLLTLAAIDNAADIATRIYALEKSIATGHWTRTETRDRDKTYNKLTMGELTALTGTFDWGRYFAALELPEQETLIVSQPSYLQAFGQLFEATPVATWREYLTYHLIAGYADLLPVAFVDARFEFNSRTLAGTEENQARWKRGVALANAYVGHAVGKFYVARYFPPEAKLRMQSLVENLKTAMAERLDRLDWMSAETKTEARAKLDKFTTKIGYPDKWRDYSALEIRADDLLGNARRARQFAFQSNVERLGKPVDRDQWFINPQLVNAFYNPFMNEIVFPAGILQPPFFNMAADDAVNYGAIVAVIGHEVGHGFDDQGAKSDGDGNLRNWWSEEDSAEFEKRTNALVTQYDAYSPIEGEHVNGRLTLGENIGDLGGVTLAYHAYKTSLQGQQAPVIDGLTGEQRFFMGWAQVWRSLSREPALRRQLIVDPHAPTQYRANGPLSNFSGFYDAYGVVEGDAMYRPTEQRVSIW